MRILFVAALCTLAAAGTARALTVTPNPVTVGGTQIGVPITKDVALQNNGNATVKVMTIALTSGQGPFNLLAVPQLPISLPAGTGFNFTVQFSPSQNGITNGSIGIVSNDPNTPNLNVPTSGYAGPPAISLDSGTVAFGGVNLGASSIATVVNVLDCDPLGCGMGTTGFSDLNVTDISLSGANAGDFILDKKALPGIVPAQGMSPFTITFHPTVLGNRSATVTVMSSAGSRSISLLGSGTMSMLTVDKNTLDFGNVAVKVKSNAQTVTLGNSGTGMLQVMSIAFDDPSFSQSVGTKPPFAIGSMGSSPIGVICTPQKLGNIAGSATITTDVGVQTVNLTCVGIAPMLTITPNPIDCGKIALGSSSGMIAVTLKNAGTDVLHINFLNISGGDQADFISNDEPNTPIALPPSGMQIFHIVFTPTGNGGAETAELDVGSDDPLMPSATVPITGTAIVAGIGLSPAAPIDFGAVMVGQTSPAKMLTIENTGDIDVTVNTISIGGTGASFFNVDMKGPLSIKSGQSTPVMVTFQPLTAATEMAVITVTPAGLQAASVQLKGTGVAPMMKVSPASFDFGSIAVGSPSDPLTVAIANTGGTPFTITSISSGNSAFTINMDSTKTMVAPNGGTTFGVVYTPTGAMTDHSTVTVKIMESMAVTGSLAVSGTGVMAMPRPAPGGCAIAPRRVAPIPLALLGLLALLRWRFRRRGGR